MACQYIYHLNIFSVVRKEHEIIAFYIECVFRVSLARAFTIAPYGCDKTTCRYIPMHTELAGTNKSMCFSVYHLSVENFEYNYHTSVINEGIVSSNGGFCKHLSA